MKAIVRGARYHVERSSDRDCGYIIRGLSLLLQAGQVPLQLAADGVEDCLRLNRQCIGDGEDLMGAQATLAGFHFRHERLRFAELAGEFQLCKP